MINPRTACFLDHIKTALWAQVTETPDDIKIKVLVKGINSDLIVIIVFGGHTPPIAILGFRLEWK